MGTIFNFDDKNNQNEDLSKNLFIEKQKKEFNKIQNSIKNIQTSNAMMDAQKKAFENANNSIKNIHSPNEFYEIGKRKFDESQALMKNNVYSAADEMLKTAQLESTMAEAHIKEMQEKVLKDDKEKFYANIRETTIPVFTKKNSINHNHTIEKNIPFAIKEERFPENERKTDQKLYKCFVIMPIGEKGTQEYIENIEVFENIIKKSVKSCGYNIDCYHADLINDPGSIPEQIINSLENDAIVVADLRRNNPNVIWELGVRHTFQKRSIIIFSQTKVSGTYRGRCCLE